MCRDADSCLLPHVRKLGEINSPQVLSDEVEQPEVRRDVVVFGLPGQLPSTDSLTEWIAEIPSFLGAVGASVIEVPTSIELESSSWAEKGGEDPPPDGPWQGQQVEEEPDREVV
jgi:hypothetical protein